MTDDAVTRILRRDPRFARAAYDFVRESLRQAVQAMTEPQHVSPRELLEIIRIHALDSFGPLAGTVLRDWGVTRTDDFGEIVFHLIAENEFGKSADDTLADFHDVYSFDDVFPSAFAGMGEVRVHSSDEDDLYDDLYDDEGD
jgi:uncharacterized repeat protein (TIGR04138 family)